MFQDPNNTPGTRDNEMAAMLDPGLADYYLNEDQSTSPVDQPMAHTTGFKLNVQPPTIIDKLSPTQLYFGEHLAKSVGNQNASSDYLPLFGQGMTPKEIYGKENQIAIGQQAMGEVQRIQKEIEDFVEKNKGLGDKEFEKAKGEWLKEGQNTPQLKHAEIQKLTPLEIGITLFGMATNPRYAANIGASAFEAKLGQQAKDQERNDKQYQVDKQNHDAKMEQLGTIAQQAYRDLEYLRKRSDEVLDRKLTDLEESQKKQSKLLGDAIEGILSPKQPGHARESLKEAIRLGLDPQRAAAYGEIADAAENKFVLDAQADADKAKLDADTKTKAWWNTVADQFNGEYRSFRTTSGEVTQADLKRFTDKRNAILKDGIPANLLDDPVAGKTASASNKDEDQAYRQGRDQIGDEQWRQMFNLSQARENRISAAASAPKATPQQKETYRKIQKYNDTIETSRAAYDTLSSAKPSDPEDEKAAAAWQKRVDDTLTDFRAARRQKDAALGIKRKPGYYETALPDGRWWSSAEGFFKNVQPLEEGESIESVAGELSGQVGGQKPKAKTSPKKGGKKPSTAKPSGAKYKRGPNGEVIRA